MSNVFHLLGMLGKAMRKTKCRRYNVLKAEHEKLIVSVVTLSCKGLDGDCFMLRFAGGTHCMPSSSSSYEISNLCKF